MGKSGRGWPLWVATKRRVVIFKCDLQRRPSRVSNVCNEAECGSFNSHAKMERVVYFLTVSNVCNEAECGSLNSHDNGTGGVIFNGDTISILVEIYSKQRPGWVSVIYTSPNLEEILENIGRPLGPSKNSTKISQKGGPF